MITTKRTPGAAEQTGGLDPEEAVGLLLRDLRASQDGLSTAEAQRRILQYGPNELRRRAGRRWPSELAAQLTHPLALLLWAVAGLSFLVFALRGGLIPLPLTVEATTMSFVGMIAGQIGTAFAVRAGSGSLHETGVFTNRYLVAAIAGVIVFAGLFVYAPSLQSLLATVALSPRDVLFLLPYPFVVWGADESRRWLVRRRRRHGAALVPGP